MHQAIMVISFILALLPVSSFAATYYVAKTGDDANSCSQAQSQNTPRLTIQGGVNCATAGGDTIIVKAGTYVENVTNWRSGVSGNLITLKANPGDSVIWKNPSTSTTGFNCQVQIYDRSYIRIEGFIFRDTIPPCVIRVLETDTNKSDGDVTVGIEIVNNTFINNGNNASNSGWMTRVIYFQYVGRDSSYSGSTLSLIQGNTFKDNYGANIDFDNTSNVRVANNTSTGNRGSKNDSNANWYQTNLIQMGGTGSQRNIIEDNIVSNISRQPYMETDIEGSGLRIDVGPNRNIFRRNIIHNICHQDNKSKCRGIFNEDNAHFQEFRENIIYNIGNSCVEEGGWWVRQAFNNSYINNVIYNCGKTGLIVQNARNSTFKNNIIMNAGVAEVSVWDKSVNMGNTFSYNLYYNTARSQIGVWNVAPNQPPYENNHPANLTLSQWNLLSGDKYSLSVDPQFVSPPSDFHLQPYSPAIGAGEGGVTMGAYTASSGSFLPAPANLRLILW